MSDKRILQWRLRPPFSVGQCTDRAWTDYAKKGPKRLATQEDVDKANTKALAAMPILTDTDRLFEYRLKP